MRLIFSDIVSIVIVEQERQIAWGGECLRDALKVGIPYSYDINIAGLLLIQQNPNHMYSVFPILAH